MFHHLLDAAVDHPFIGSGLAFLFVLILILGTLHVLRIFAGVLIVLIREFKHELLGIGKALARVKDELTSWRRDE